MFGRLYTFIDFGICTINTSKSSSPSLQMAMSILKYEKKDMFSFHGSGNLLFISEMQQAAFVFVLPNANEHRERKGFPIKYV